MELTLDELYAEYEDLDARDQSQYLLELGYDLPELPEAERLECNRVHGCQSQVWLTAVPVDESSDPVISISADSDSQIVRGLITVLLAAYSGRTASKITALDIEAVFERLHLKQYISPQRRNGLQGMVDRIRFLAARFGEEGVKTGDQVAESPIASADSPNAVCGPFDVVAVRNEFPILHQDLGGGMTPVYLDSGASAQKPLCVIEKEREVEEQYFANAYRGRYSFGARIDEELEASREEIARFIGAVDPRCIAFTPGTTATLNMIAFGWGAKHLRPGDEILISELEHHANFVPWQQVAERTGALLKFLPLTSDGLIDEDRLDDVFSDRTRIVAVTGMSNVLGTVPPIDRLTQRAHAAGGIIVVDGAQSVPHAVTDVTASGIDFLVFSGHKLYGPTGVGILYGRAERLAETDPILFGGHMIDRVYKDHSTFAAAPAKFEAGTLPIVQAIGLGEAVRWVRKTGITNIHDHELSLMKQTFDRLLQIEGLTIFGPSSDQRGAILSFRIEGVHPEDLAAILDRHGVQTRHGHHCAMPLHDRLQVSATTRVSFAAYNNTDDVERLVQAVEEAVGQLRRAS